MSTQEQPPHQHLRLEIEEALRRGDATAARSLVAQLWRETPGPATAGFVLARLEALRGQRTLVPCRVAILRSFTVEPVVPLLRVGAFLGGIDVMVQVGDYNAYAQALLDKGSELYRFGPDVVILAVRTADVAPELWEEAAGLDEDGVRAAVERVVGLFRQLVCTFRERSQAYLLLHNLELPAVPNRGVLDGHAGASQLAALQQVNRGLALLARSHTGVYVLDYDGLVARHGRLSWHDERKHLALRLPIAGPCLPHLADEWLRFLHPLCNRSCKVLAIDLDNTLWGGVIGEDGPAGIKLGADYPGAAYRSLQRAILDLHARGVLLAVCSKNNLPEALEVLRAHPEMLLRPEHFAALRINWADKAKNLREIAAELNLGLDAVAFLDDNPAERDWIRTQLPEVTVLELPADPIQYAGTLRAAPVFERLALSHEDRDRGRYYAEQRLREQARQDAGSLEDYYYSLQMHAEVVAAVPDTLPRLAQLTQKTNQFNLTTRRYNEAQLEALAADPCWLIRGLRVRDRYGDNGIVALALLHDDGPSWQIDTLLMSCRVIGRTVEKALLALLAQEVKRRDGRKLVGWYFPTAKNAPAKDFYSSHGFTPLGQQGGGQGWLLDLTRARIDVPPWIEVHSSPQERLVNHA